MESKISEIVAQADGDGRQLSITEFAHKARVVRYLAVRALLAARDMPAERRRATALDRRHHLQLAEADMPAVGSTPCRAVVAEDIRDLQRWSSHGGLAGGFGILLEPARMRSSGLSISRMISMATCV